MNQDNKSFTLSIDEIHEIMRLNGHRLTVQRECILDIFFNNKKSYHLSADDIHRELVIKGKTYISLATVYRTVKILHELCILREVSLSEGHKQYELSSKKEMHHHIICLNNNETIEFFCEEVNEIARKIAEKHRIMVLDIELKILGKQLLEMG